MCPALSENPFPVKSLPPLAVILLNNCQLSFHDRVSGFTPLCSYKSLTHSLNTGRYVSVAKEQDFSSFLHGVHVVSWTKYNCDLMRVQAILRVCRLSQERKLLTVLQPASFKQQMVLSVLVW